MELLAVGLGCALGAVCRYLLETGLNGWLADPHQLLRLFPHGTLHCDH